MHSKIAESKKNVRICEQVIMQPEPFFILKTVSFKITFLNMFYPKKVYMNLVLKHKCEQNSA